MPLSLNLPHHKEKEMLSTFETIDRINEVLTELYDLSSALDACEPDDPNSLLRVITEERSIRLFFVHMELLQLVTVLPTRWWPDWQPPRMDVGARSSERMPIHFLDPRNLPHGTFGSLVDDIRNTCTSVLEFRRTSDRYRWMLKDDLLKLQAHLTRHSAYCMHFCLRAFQNREATRVLKEALTT